MIQVKRLTSNVQRPVLDALRGSLHRVDAFQGTIITLSNFSKGTKEAAFERGAAPITLINGEKLIELLIENEIAVKKKQIDYFLIDGDYFVESDEEVEWVYFINFFIWVTTSQHSIELYANYFFLTFRTLFNVGILFARIWNDLRI